MRFSRGPTILAFAAVLATMALAFSLLTSTGTASAATQSSNPGFVASGSTDAAFQTQLATSNTFAQNVDISSAQAATRGSPALTVPRSVTVAGLDATLSTSRGSTADATGSVSTAFNAVPAANLYGLSLVLIVAIGVGFAVVFRRTIASMTFGLRFLSQDAAGHVPKRADSSFAGFATRAVAVVREIVLRGLSFGASWGFQPLRM